MLIILMATTTIPISKEFHDWLKSKGRKGESYEDVIKRLLSPEFKEEVGGTQDTSEDTTEGPSEDSSEESSENNPDVSESLDN